MKRILFFIFIFWFFVFISSFSWAQTSSYIDTSVVGSPLGNINIYNYYQNDFSFLNVPFSDVTSCVVMYDSSSNYTIIYLSPGNFYTSPGDVYTINSSSYNGSNYNFQFTFVGTSYLGSGLPRNIQYSPSYVLVSNAIYTDDTFTSFYNSNYVTGNNTLFFDNAFNYGDVGDEPGGDEPGGDEPGSGDEPGGEEPGEDENNFISSLADMLIHIVVPTNEQWQDIQDSFEDNIMGKFALTSMTFNDDLIYDNLPSIGTQENITPSLSFGSYGTINFDYLVEFINTPLSFGFLNYAYGGSTLQYNLPTNGITFRDVINFFFIIDVFILNLYLYNKFLSKEGV